MANNLPMMNMPEQSGEYKVVQFEGNGIPYLRFAREQGKSGDFHGFILAGFATEIGVECAEIPGPCGLVAALPEDTPYRMSGAGMCNINLEKRTAVFSGSSFDYDRGINQDHLQRLRAELPDWNLR